MTKGVDTTRHPLPAASASASSLPGWDVTSDLQLEVGQTDSTIAITCLALSLGHHGDTMTEKAEREVIVLSK